MFKKNVFALAVFILTALLLAGCGGSGIAPSEVTIDVSIIEIKGATDGIDPPSDDPEGLSSGYRFKPPGEYDAENPNKWQVSTYLFSPSAFTVIQGDTVTMRTFVVNGDEHTVELISPDGVLGESIVMNRGREYSFTFTADQAGYYTLHCEEHHPTMSIQILALPGN